MGYFTYQRNDMNELESIIAKILQEDCDAGIDTLSHYFDYLDDDDVHKMFAAVTRDYLMTGRKHLILYLVENDCLNLTVAKNLLQVCDSEIAHKLLPILGDCGYELFYEDMKIMRPDVVKLVLEKGLCDHMDPGSCARACISRCNFAGFLVVCEFYQLAPLDMMLDWKKCDYPVKLDSFVGPEWWIMQIDTLQELPIHDLKSIGRTFSTAIENLVVSPEALERFFVHFFQSHHDYLHEHDLPTNVIKHMSTFIWVDIFVDEWPGYTSFAKCLNPGQLTVIGHCPKVYQIILDDPSYRERYINYFNAASGEEILQKLHSVLAAIDCGCVFGEYLRGIVGSHYVNENRHGAMAQYPQFAQGLLRVLDPMTIATMFVHDRCQLWELLEKHDDLSFTDLDLGLRPVFLHNYPIEGKLLERFLQEMELTPEAVAFTIEPLIKCHEKFYTVLDNSRAHAHYVYHLPEIISKARLSKANIQWWQEHYGDVELDPGSFLPFLYDLLWFNDRMVAVAIEIIKHLVPGIRMDVIQGSYHIQDRYFCLSGFPDVIPGDINENMVVTNVEHLQVVYLRTVRTTPEKLYELVCDHYRRNHCTKNARS